jgi:hypothetical protein
MQRVAARFPGHVDRAALIHGPWLRGARALHAGANGVIDRTFAVYHRFAYQRQPNGFPSQRDFPFLFVRKPRIHHFDAMVGYRPAIAYRQWLRTAGAEYREHDLYFEVGKRDRLRQWPAITRDAIHKFAKRPELIGREAVLVGHSAGGFPVAALAMIMKGGSETREAIRHYFRLDNVSDPDNYVSAGEMEQLAEELKRHNALFIAIASPLNGIKITKVGHQVNDRVLKYLDPHLLTDIGCVHVEEFYARVGIRPDDVIDAILVSGSAPVPLALDIRSTASNISNLAVQFGMRAFSPFVNRHAQYERWGGDPANDPGAGHDGIVSLRSAHLVGPYVFRIDANHLEQVELERCAFTVAAMIRSLRADDFHATVIQLSAQLASANCDLPYRVAA